jgi:hypothetical protein
LFDLSLGGQQFICFTFDAFKFFRLFIVVPAMSILVGKRCLLQFWFVHFHVASKHSDFISCQVVLRVMFFTGSFVTKTM